jgi:hypothetical protein
MLRLGKSVRLTEAERRHLRMLIGRDPGSIRTVAQMNALIDHNKREAGEATPEGRLIGLLLEDFRVR